MESKRVDRINFIKVQVNDLKKKDFLVYLTVQLNVSFDKSYIKIISVV